MQKKLALLPVLLFGLALSVSLPFMARAQSATASVNGTVHDATGAVVPQVSLVLRNVDTNVEQHGATNAAGVYVFVNVLPGKYVLEASKAGFTGVGIEPFALNVNQTATVNLTLQVGSVRQTVSVEAAASQVESSTAELGQVVNTKEVNDLPLNGRNFTELLLLTPGASPIQTFSSQQFSDPTGAYAFPAINGQPNRSNTYKLDGSFNDAGWGSGTYAVPPIPDTILEFKLQSHNDDAEFGSVLGGIVNVSTKSGTNAFHGSAWEFLRNNDLDARSFFQQSITPYQQNQWGATFGGPVIIPKLYNGKNRTFFMLGYQGFRLKQDALNYYQVPTAANFNGNFSNIPQQLYNPYTTQADPNNPRQFIRQPFANNQIPTSLFNPAMLAFAKTLPAPISTGVSNTNALDQTPTITTQQDYTARLDQTLGNKDFFWFRGSGTIKNTTGSGGRQGILNDVNFWAKNIAGSWVRTISPTSVFEVLMSKERINLDNVPAYTNLPPSYASMFGAQEVTGFASVGTKVPAVQIPSYFSDPSHVEDYSPSGSTWQWAAKWTKILGRHTLKIGGEYDSSNFAGLFLWNDLAFATNQTANPESQGNTGSALASFFLGLPDNTTRRNTVETLRPGGVMSYYVQDQWKVTPKLTVNLGLRYDLTLIPPYGTKDAGNEYVGSMDMLAGVYIVQKLPPACSATQSAPCIPGGTLPAHVVVSPNGKIYKNTTTNWGPRAGIAYRLFDKTAIRAGFGIFYDNWAAQSQTAQAYEGTWPSVDQQELTNLNRPTSGAVLPNVTANNVPYAGAFPPPTPFPQYTWYVNPKTKNPYSMQWNFGVEQQITKSAVLSVNYVGSGSRRTDVGSVYNVASTPGPGDIASRSPFPYMGTAFWDNNIGKAGYEALQVSLNKSYSSGLSYLISYTRAKSIDTGCSGWYGFEGCDIQNPYHYQNDRSVSSFDLPNVFSAAFVYDVPVGKGRQFRTNNAVIDNIVGNWQVNGILNLRSGQPFNVNVAGDIPNTGENDVRPNLVGNAIPAQQTVQQWLLASAFAPPAQYTFGNLGRNVFRTDWGRNLDLSVFRQFPIRELLRLEFRAEAFNLTNTPVFAAPASNISYPNFGQISSTINSGRQVQFALKLLF